MAAFDIISKHSELRKLAECKEILYQKLKNVTSKKDMKTFIDIMSKWEVSIDAWIRANGFDTINLTPSYLQDTKDAVYYPDEIQNTLNGFVKSSETYGASKFMDRNDILYAPYRDLSSVTDIRNCFQRCNNICYVEPETFMTTSKVTNMNNLFYGCQRLSLDEFTIRIDSATNMQNMFYGCGIKRVNLLNMKNNVANVASMFNRSDIEYVSGVDMSFTKNSTKLNNEMFSYSKLRHIDYSPNSVLYSDNSASGYVTPTCDKETINNFLNQAYDYSTTEGQLLRAEFKKVNSNIDTSGHNTELSIKSIKKQQMRDIGFTEAEITEHENRLIAKTWHGFKA